MFGWMQRIPCGNNAQGIFGSLRRIETQVFFFHAKATNCKQRNAIHGLYDANGDWQEDETRIE